MIEYCVCKNNNGDKQLLTIDIVPMKYKNLNYGIRYSIIYSLYYLFDLNTGRYIAKNENKQYLTDNIEAFYHRYEKYISDNPEKYRSYIEELEELKKGIGLNTNEHPIENEQNDAV